MKIIPLNFGKKILFFGLTILMLAAPGTVSAAAFRFASVGDAHVGTAKATSTLNQINTLSPQLILFNGDLENDGVTKSEMDPIINVFKNASDYEKTFFVRGNHDDHLSGSAAAWQSYFTGKQLPAGVTNYVGIDNNSTYLTYSFDYGNARFIGLDANGDADPPTAAQLSFLDARLTDAEAKGLTHAFIFTHPPEYCVESTHCSCKTATGCGPSSQYYGIINKHPIVSATFHGHEHIAAWVHMNSSRVPGLTHEYEEFITSSMGNPYSFTPYASRMDWYSYSSSTAAFGMVEVNGNNFTVSIYHTGTTTALWSKTFTKSGATGAVATATKVPTATKAPNSSPTKIPTATKKPTATATSKPNTTKTPTATKNPTSVPTNIPTITQFPTNIPTAIPTPVPTISWKYKGDANFDGQVDEADYEIWRLNYGRSLSEGGYEGDFNQDGQIDGVDYVIWLSTLSNGVIDITPAVQPTNVPTAVPTQNGGIGSETLVPTNPATATPTVTKTPTATKTPTGTRTPTATKTPSSAPSATKVPTATKSPTTAPTVTMPPAPAGLRAFPGAEGYGANATGGRGGKVILVTNTNDSGAGSLRECINASGKRICVFKVGGLISLNSALTIGNGDLTIAGQSAPGGGITLKLGSSNEVFSTKASNVIIRYLTQRPGPGGENHGNQIAANNKELKNIMIDHNSISWGVDSNIETWYRVVDATIQWTIVSEGLDCSTHSKGCHSKGLMIGGYKAGESGSSAGSGNISVLHNLMAHDGERTPLIQMCGMGQVINNITYNPYWTFAHQQDNCITSSQNYVNWIGNYHKKGPDSTSGTDLKILPADSGGYSGNSKIYVKGNIGPSRTSDSLPDSNWVESGSQKYISATAFAGPAVTTTDAMTAYNQVLADAGNNKGLNCDGSWYNRRDAIDTRVVNDVKNGTGKIIDNPSEVGGWITPATGTACADADNDGMPDAWETKYGQMTNTADQDGDGYTNIEEYLNGTNPTVKN